MSTKGRILVGLGPLADSLAALETAAELAMRLRAELVGLFVEDVDLINLASLPFAQEISPSAVGRKLDLAAMESDLKARAAAARRALEMVALRHHLEWRFEIARGPTSQALLAAAMEAEMVALGCALNLGRGFGGILPSAAGTVIASARVALICAAELPVGQTVILLHDGTPAAWQGLEMAIRLARPDGRISVLLAAADDEQAGTLRNVVAKRLAETGLGWHARPLAAASQAALLTALAQEPPGLLVLPVDGGLITETAPESLLAQMRRPLLLVRAPPAPAAQDPAQTP